MSGGSLSGVVWINWISSCRRTDEFCNFLGITPNTISPGKPRLLSLVYLTIKLLVEQKPKIVLVASMRAVLVAIALRPMFRYTVVLDAHYSAIVPRVGFTFLCRYLYDYVHCRADLVLVTNESHAEIVRERGGTALVLQDKLPSPPKFFPITTACKAKRVVCICSYSHDEPIDEMLKAASLLLNEDIFFYFTGNSSGMIDKNFLPPNVILTGYLPEMEYWQVLQDATIIIDLTTRENCLVCGAYEAVAVEKPMVLSNTTALRGYFTKGVVFAENKADDIAAKIRLTLLSEMPLADQVKELKREIEEKWNPAGTRLRAMIYDASTLKQNILRLKRLGTTNG